MFSTKNSAKPSSNPVNGEHEGRDRGDWAGGLNLRGQEEQQRQSKQEQTTHRLGDA